jgi:hypothetical protein
MSTETPRIEPWLLLMLSSFIPIILMAFVPEGGRVGLAVLAGAPLLVGFGILIMKHWPKDDTARAPKRASELEP